MPVNTDAIGKTLPATTYAVGREKIREFAASIADYCLLTRKAVDGLRRLRESHRFLRGLVQWLGFPVAKVNFRPAARPAGISRVMVNGRWAVVDGASTGERPGRAL